MKRTSLTRTLKTGLLAVPAAAMMLGSSHAAQLGINFYGSGYHYGATNVTATAFGIGTNDWFTTSEADDEAGTSVIALSTGGSLTLTWSANNTWDSYPWSPPNTNTAAPGDEEVTWGILDDGGAMWSVTLSGLRNVASDCTVQLIAATANPQSSFPDATLTASDPATQTLDYTNGIFALNGGGTASTSTVSTAYSMLSANNTISMTAGPRDTRRSSLAGLILTYTPGNNAPLVETDPQAPVGDLFPGDSFELGSLASGSPTLHYQWRQNGTDIPGANFPDYTNTSAVVGDSGSYDVVVTNAYGAVTSAVVLVTIQDVTPPVITQSPVSQSLYEGYPATFTVVASGGQLSYQWKSNTVAIADATNATYTIPSIIPDDAGTYTIDVSNPVGPTASASATLTVKVAAPGSYEQAVAGTKPALWLRYSETDPLLVVTGSAANSGSAGAADDGVAKFYTDFQQPGAIAADTNKSASFNGAQAIDVPYDPALNTATFSVELWVNPATDVNGARSPLYNRGDFGGDGWLFWAYNGSPKWQFRTYDANIRNTVTSTSDAVAGVWTHLVGVYNGTDTILYVNGVQESTNLPGTFFMNPNMPLRIGGAGNDTGAAGVNAWNGGVDEVAVYDTVLTPAVILSHYQNGTNATRSTDYDALVQASSPVGYWRLNDANGPIPPTPKNSGTLGMAWDGTYNGDIVPGTVGPRPASFPGFESDNNSVTMTNGYASSPLLPLNTNTVTVTCWLKRQDPSTTGDLSWPAWLGDGGMHMNADGELRLHWKGQFWWETTDLRVPAEMWTFCAMVVDSDNATFYMSDGTILKSSSFGGTFEALEVSSLPGFGGNQPGRSDRNYIGQIDETTVYNRALSSSEITTLFLVGTGAPFQLDIVPGGIVEDTNPSSPLHNGENLGTTWLASSSDGVKTRDGVEVFTATNGTQIVTAGAPEFNSTVGTFTFWMRANAPFPGPGNPEGVMLVDRRSSDGTVITMSQGGGIRVQCAGGANTFEEFSYLPDLVWHNIAITYDQSVTGAIEIFVDGVSSGSQVNSAAWSWPATQPIELGRSHDGYWMLYDGEMDDFRLYDRILTPAEIGAIVSNDAIVDAGALKLRYNFDTAGIGWTVKYPFGTLESTPALNPASWTPVPGATPPNYPVQATDPAMFFRATP